MIASDSTYLNSVRKAGACVLACETVLLIAVFLYAVALNLVGSAASPNGAGSGYRIVALAIIALLSFSWICGTAVVWTGRIWSPGQTTWMMIGRSLATLIVLTANFAAGAFSAASFVILDLTLRGVFVFFLLTLLTLLVLSGCILSIAGTFNRAEAPRTP